MAKRFKQIVEETLDLIEGRMNQLAMDMDELSDSEFKAKHKKSKQHMSTALNKPIKPSKEEQVDEEVEQVDEGERAKEMQAGWELLRKRKKDNEKAVKDMKGMAPHMKNPALGEEVEELDELSQDKLMQYRSAAKKQGTGIQDRMKVGGGDWSKDGKDTKTLKKRMSGYKMAGRKVNPGLAATAGKAPRVAANEEVEQLDEILPVVAAVAGRALATRAVGAGASAMTKRVAGAAGSYAGKKLANKVTSTNTSTNTTKEETEDDMVKRLKSNMKKRDAYLKSKHGGLAKIGSENKKEKEDHVDMKSVREESEQIDEGLGGAYRYNQMMKRKRNEYQGMVKKHQDAGHDLKTATNKASQEYDALEAKRRKNARPLPQTRDLMKMSTDELKRLQKKESLEVKPIKLTKGWGDGGKSMKTNKNKLVGNQHKIDANDDGKISTDDFKILRNRNKARNQ